MSTWRRSWLTIVLLSVAGAGRLTAADVSARFAHDTLSLNGIAVGEVNADRAVLSLPAFVQVLGTPTRSRVDGDTERLTWDTAGIQLEAMSREGVVFAVLFQFTGPDTNQGIIPSGQYRGTFDCLGVALTAGEQNPDRIKLLSAAGFHQDSGSDSGETWSLRFEYWAVYLRFSAGGTIDSAVIRVQPDIY